MRRNSPEAVFIPKLNSRDSDYPEFHGSLIDAGFTVHTLYLDWEGPESLQDLSEQAARHLDAIDPSPDAALIGHSMGGRVAMLEASRRQYGKLVLCAPTPDLKDIAEDQESRQLVEAKKAWLRFVNGLALDGLARKIKIPEGRRHVLMGSEQGYPDLMQKFTTRLAQQLGTEVEIIEGAGHELEQSQEFIAAVTLAAGSNSSGETG